MSAQTLLAIETSSATASIALAIGEAITEETIAIPREQTGLALGIIDRLLARAGIRLAALDAIVFGQGPGSFTGLRIAAAIAQGLSLGSGRPIVPVSSLAALAQRALAQCAPGAPAPGQRAPAAERGAERGAGPGAERGAGPAAELPAERVLCCVDARMGEVYTASFTLTNGLAVALAAESIGPPAAVRPPAAPYLAVGDGLTAHAAALEAVIAGAIACDPGLYPRARDLLPLAAGRVARGEFVPIEAALPLYLRESGAWRTS